MARFFGYLLALCVSVLAATPAYAAPLASPGGGIENSTHDPSGIGILILANAGTKTVQRMFPSGAVETVAIAPDPGAVITHRERLFFATGNSGESLLFNHHTGTIESVDFTGGDHQTIASGLVAPNGMTFVGDELFYTTAGGVSQGVYRVLDGRGILLNDSIPLPDGLATGSDGMIYVGSLAGGVYRLNPATGASSLVAWTPGPIDDLTVFGNQIYAASTVGMVFQINPAGGVSTVVAHGPEFFGASSVKPGLDGLVVTTLTGNLMLIHP